MGLVDRATRSESMRPWYTPERPRSPGCGDTQWFEPRWQDRRDCCRPGRAVGAARVTGLTQLETANATDHAICAGRGANSCGPDSMGCMGVSVGHRPGREITRALLEQIAGGEAGRRLHGQLARWNTDMTAEQIEDAIQEACSRAARLCVGQVEGEVYSWLRTTAHREIAAQRRRRERERIADVCVDDLELTELSAPAADVAAITREDHIEIARVARVVLEQLSERQRDIVVLHTHGLRRRQIAEYLQLSPRTVKRAMEQVLAVGRDELVRLAGHGCEAGEGHVARLAFGLADTRETRLAQLHLTSCRRCGVMYERLDLWREKVAAVLPVPVVAGAHEHTVERVVHAVADGLPGPPAPAQPGSPGLRQHASDAVAQLREHATAAYYRTIDPTPLAGARPGAVAAAVAGCLAVGGSAAYCPPQVRDSIAALSGLTAQTRPDHKPRPPQPTRVRAAQAPTTPAPAATAPVTIVAQPTAPPPPPVSTPPAPPPPPAPEQEFEPSGSAVANTTPMARRPAAAGGSSQTASEGPTEFGGP